MSAALFLILAKEIGAPLARRVLDGLSAKPGAAEKLQVIVKIVEGGSTAIAACRATFGDDFMRTFTASTNDGRGGWTYEAGRAEYIKLDAEVTTPPSQQALLRDELNINVERVHSVYGSKDAMVNNYLLGLFAEWKVRYLGLVGANEASALAFEAIDSLLAGRQKNVAGALSVLQKSMGFPAALMIVYAGMLLTSTGVGLLAAVSAGVMGVPMVNVAGFALGGVALFGFSRLKISRANAHSMAIAAAYKLLELGPVNAAAAQKISD